ncbi:hypothetical protein [Spirochaeta thermophila]|uniref:hypothetical protein n=1 Tax=Winmispira thermophila TaxID=154 RepID=UPI0001F1223B|nr:hypothetical protein [Spirochaeta thermophila]
MRHRASVVLAVFFLAVLFLGAQESPDYREMVADIEGLLEGAYASYLEGKAEDARNAVQDAYFEVFENLEGPIRINLGMQVNVEMEGLFADIRTLISEGADRDEVRRKIDLLLARLQEILPVVDAGHVLVAEAGEEETARGEAPPEWVATVDFIEGELRGALDMFASGDVDGAVERVRQTFFAGYKNTGLEIAIRTQRSQSENYAYEAAFNDVAKHMRESGSLFLAEDAAARLVSALRDEIVGLEVPEGAGMSPKTVQGEEIPEADWGVVVGQVSAALEEALSLARMSRGVDAARVIQNSYFDHFEASGMETALGVRDPDRKLEIEGAFTALASALKEGDPEAEAYGRRLVSLLDEAAGAFRGDGEDRGASSCTLS